MWMAVTYVGYCHPHPASPFLLVLKPDGLGCGLEATRHSVCIHHMNPLNSCYGYGLDDSNINIDSGIFVTSASGGNWRRYCFHLCLSFCETAFSALTVLVGWQERHPACKKTERWGTGMVICLEWGANDLHMVQPMPLPPHHLLQSQYLTTQFLQAGCPSCHPINSVKALRSLQTVNSFKAALKTFLLSHNL